MKTTYGVRGMMEWVALIPSGRNIVRVRFTGGSLSGYGVVPACFTTDNPVVMRLIENSGYFRRGKIIRLSSHPDVSFPGSCGEKDMDEIPGETVTIRKEIR
ncbi:MAG: hypothetical protein K2J70_04645 [Muribaculaceae bacterium]|nr:hypothetical protein [Muribaculaceae bacterium]